MLTQGWSGGKLASSLVNPWAPDCRPDVATSRLEPAWGLHRSPPLRASVCTRVLTQEASFVQSFQKRDHQSPEGRGHAGFMVMFDVEAANKYTKSWTSETRKWKSHETSLHVHQNLNCDKTKCCQRCRGTGSFLRFWWGCTMAQPLQSQFGDFSKN